MGPEHDLPFSDLFTTTEQYVESVLDFAQRDRLLQTLCGGVHILDFFTNSPDLYASILEESWRSFIAAHDIMDFLNLLLREPLDQFDGEALTKWRDGPVPPASLLAYIREVRKHLLLREPLSSQCSRNRAIKPVQKLAWHVAVGMNIKKVHEVGLFASYIENLTSSISQETGHEITHLVDFGSGQNYLGRALASPPYRKHIVAIETKGHNQDRAKQLDEAARLVPVQKFLFDRKAEIASRPKKKSDKLLEGEMKQLAKAVEKVGVKIEPAAANVGTVQYVEHFIKDGDLADVISEIEQAKAEEGATTADRPQALVMSLHSCGNLVHHGLRSMVLNDDVKAVAMIGCCYNLITERLSPATYKLPELRPSAHPRVEKEHSACDPHGFPMSDRFCNLSGQGIKLNITARMMAVQAPKNWGERDSGARDSDGFFKRHFYRALLQRVFLDKGVVGPPSVEYIGGSPLGHSSGTPIIIGSLRKGCYTTFVAYVRGALGKLVDDSEQGEKFKVVADMTDAEIEDYAECFAYRKKELSAIWSLMAFSAGVVEALIVVDRYLWLKEQPDVARAWAEAVFDYGMSPRNIVVVGVKK